MHKQEFRTSVLTSYGASAAETSELLAYNENVFNSTSLTPPFNFPLAPEPHVAAWEFYLAEASQVGVFNALQRRLIQLQFPIVQGISQTSAYQEATRKGVLPPRQERATGLVLKEPDKLQLFMYESLAGVIPVLVAPCRDDFVSLVRSLTMRNEPLPVPASMGACMVAGFNNWDRVRQYRQQWETQNPDNCSQANWQKEFQRFIPLKELYQDRFIILSDGPYSNVSSNDVGLDQEMWRCTSLAIRLEHECTHYFTRRLFGSMRNNLLDELIADYRGIVYATGAYRADWFLRFLGVESFPHYRQGGRLENYRGQPPLSDSAFQILQALVKAAASNLEAFDAKLDANLRTTNGQAIMVMALSALTIEELACSQAHSIVQNTLDELHEKFLLNN